MRATVMYAAGDVQVVDLPDPSLVESTDALVRVTTAERSGSASWSPSSMQQAPRATDRTTCWPIGSRPR